MTAGARGSVPTEQVRGILAAMVAERQQLRRDGADRSTLEANRMAIVYWQSQLSHALLEEHAPVPPALSQAS